MTQDSNSGLQFDRRFRHYRLIDYIYPANVRSDFHRDRYPRISIILKGHLKETTHRQEAWASPLSIVAKPPDALHANQFGPGETRIISIVSKDKNGWPQYLEASLLNSYRWFQSLSDVGAVGEFLATFPKIKSDAALEEAMIQLLAGLTDSTPVAQAAVPPKWLREIAEELADRCDESIQIQDLARSTDVHPVYLARKFRQFFHCNPKQYQHQFRLRRAIAQLTQKDPLVHVALDNGYADQSHFSRLFKSTVGMSPGNFQKLLARI